MLTRTTCTHNSFYSRHKGMHVWKKQHWDQSLTKPTKWPVCPTKTQMSLGIHPVWLEPLLCTLWVAKDPVLLRADREDWSDRADAQADLSSLGAQLILLVSSCCSSFFVQFQKLECRENLHYGQPRGLQWNQLLHYNGWCKSCSV